MTWWVLALISAAAAAATGILAKIGVHGVPSNLATALRTVVVIVFAWVMVLVSGQLDFSVLSGRSLLFLGLSGIATGLSWLAYFRALDLAPASRVAPIDKSSLGLTIILAGVVLAEPIGLPVAIGAALIVAGALITIDWSRSAKGERGWWVFAALAALFAAATAILAKIGIEGVPSNLATALRTVVVLVFAWGIVLARHEHRALASISRRSLLFLGLSGLGTGISWLCYYAALSLAPASSVAPIDKASLALTIVLAAIFLKERITLRLAIAVVLITGGAMLTLLH